jgi:hypothetical protein
MKTIEETRANILEHFQHSLRRPFMYGGMNVVRAIFEKLIFIDENETAYESTIGNESFVRFFGPGWVAAPFWWKFGGKYDRYNNELGSVYAEIGFRLGYLELDRILSAGEWEMLRKGLRDRVRKRDWTASEILEEFGPASFKTGWSVNQVLCYSNGIIDNDWIYFDFEAKREDPKSPGSGWPADDRSIPDPPLRDVRLPAKDFSHSLVLTPYGRCSAIEPIQY